MAQDQERSNKAQSLGQSSTEWLTRQTQCEPEKATIEQIMGHLYSLALFYPQQELSKKDANLKFQVFCGDMRHVPEPILGEACRRYRTDAKNRFFPTPGQLLALCKIEQAYIGPPVRPAIDGPLCREVPPHPCPVPRIAGRTDADLERMTLPETLQSLEETRKEVPAESVVYLDNVRGKYPPRRIGLSKKDRDA